MICPVCNCEKTMVVDSRPVEDDRIKRRRECAWCGFRFNTIELTETLLERIFENDKDRKN